MVWDGRCCPGVGVAAAIGLGRCGGGGGVGNEWRGSRGERDFLSNVTARGGGFRRFCRRLMLNGRKTRANLGGPINLGLAIYYAPASFVARLETGLTAPS